MNFKNYLDDDIKNFRKIKIGLVKNSDKIISDNFELGNDLIQLKDELNKKLSKNYKGKFKFDYCLIEDIKIEDLKMKYEIDKERLKREFYIAADKLAKMQTEMERRKFESLRDS